MTLAVPFTCGRSAASACGFDSRAARRLASAWRITGSLCRASSNTPSRSLVCATPTTGSRARTMITARFMRSLVLPGSGTAAVSCATASELKARRLRSVHQRVDDRLEQAVRGPGSLADAVDEARLHDRRLARHHEQPPADLELALETRVVHGERAGHGNGVIALATFGREPIGVHYLDVAHAEVAQIARRQARELLEQLQRPHPCARGAQARSHEPRARAHFQHPHSRGGLECLQEP